MRLDRPTGYLLLFYPISFALVSYSDINFELLKYLLIFFVGSIVMRSAGCIVNDILDINIDKKVIRTKSRPLASSQISISSACFTLVILLIIGLIILINLNYPSIILSLVIAPLIIFYPLAKRYFVLPQIILAMTYNWGCLIGWAAINSPYDFKNIFLLYLSLVVWTLVYDTVYAVQDEEDDKKMNLFSSAIVFGSNRTIILNFLILVQYSLLLIYGFKLGYNLVFYLCVFFILLINIMDINLIWKNHAYKSGEYFKRNNYYGFFILLSIIFGSQFNV